MRVTAGTAGEGRAASSPCGATTGSPEEPCNSLGLWWLMLEPEANTSTRVTCKRFLGQR